MEEDIKKKINQVEDYLCDVGLDLEYARDELNILYDALEEKQNNSIKDINNFKRELKGYNINKISKELNYDWQQVKNRLNEIYDNPELLEEGE
jgi:hypothetical protein